MERNYFFFIYKKEYLSERVDLLEDIKPIAVVVEEDLLANLCRGSGHVQLDQHGSDGFGD